MGKFDDELMFSDLQAITGTSAVLSSQAIDLAPLQDVLGRNIGVGTPLYVEVYGQVVTGTLTGTMRVDFLTDADSQLGSPTIVEFKATLTIPTATSAKALIWMFPIQNFVALERYIGLQYTMTVSPASNLLVTAGVTLVPSRIRNYGSGMNFA